VRGKPYLYGRNRGVVKQLIDISRLRVDHGMSCGLYVR
jgi:hypothetical protein